jgi:paraquat-inducible protein A
LSSISLTPLGAPISPAAPAKTHAVSPDELVACPDCGLAQRLRRPRFHEIAVCTRCRAVLGAAGSPDLKIPLAMAITGLFLAAIANLTPLLTVRLAGIVRPSLLITGPIALGEDGLGPLGVLVAALSILVPLIWLASIVYVLMSIELGRRPAALAPGFKLAEWLRPLAMVDVYLLGGFVAFTRLRDLAVVEIGPGGWALAALALVMIAVDAMLDRRRIWDLIGPPRRPTEQDDESGWAMCSVCGYVMERETGEGTAPAPRCPRCRSAVRDRKPNSVARTWALVLAGYVLYLPANLLPVLTVIRFGRDRPSTILGGVRELIAADMWPLALVVLLASVAVPLIKLGGLTWLLISLQRKSDRNLVRRTRLYRTIDAIGRWANIDIFAISTLVALVRFGTITSIEPELGAAMFAAVVVVTMLAAGVFDPRLMWDAAEHRHAR